MYPSKFEVSPVTPEEYKEIVTSPNIIGSLKKANDGETPTYTDDSYIIRYGKYRAMGTILHSSEGVYEIHIAVPIDSVRYCRVLALGAMTWIKEEYDTNAKAVFTTAPEGKIANFVRQLGFTQSDKVADKLYFTFNFTSLTNRG
jgi:hypothetical protein